MGPAKFCFSYTLRFNCNRAGTTRRGLFGDSLFLLDRSVGRIIDLLDTLGVTNNTLLIFTADKWVKVQAAAVLRHV